MFREHNCSDTWSRNARFVSAALIVLIFLFVPGTLAQKSARKASVGNANPDPVLSEQLPQSTTLDEGAMASAVPPKAMRFYLRAVRELHRHANTSAEKDALHAAQLDANFADANALAATAALAQRQFLHARAEAGDAVEADAKDEKAWVILATADNYLAKYTDAAAALLHVSQQHQTTWQVAYQWARAEAGQDHGAQMLQWANVAALTAPEKFAPLHLVRASALLGASQYSAAANELEIYLQLSNQNAAERPELTRELGRIRLLARSTLKTEAWTSAPKEYNALAN